MASFEKPLSTPFTFLLQSSFFFYFALKILFRAFSTLSSPNSFKLHLKKTSTLLCFFIGGSETAMVR